MLKEKKVFVRMNTPIHFHGTFYEKGKKYDVFIVQGDKRFRVIGGVDTLPPDGNIVKGDKIERPISNDEYWNNEPSACSVQGGASRRRNAKRHGKQRRTRHRISRKTRRS